MSHITDTALKEFISNPENIEYLNLAMELGLNKVPVKRVKEVFIK